MKRIVILLLAAMMAGLCACSAQTVWETVGGAGRAVAISTVSVVFLNQVLRT